VLERLNSKKNSEIKTKGEQSQEKREGTEPLRSAKGNFHSLIMARILQDGEREQLGC
jgi:DNA-binding TFAR19-related protein (PDSD5 family)